MPESTPHDHVLVGKQSSRTKVYHLPAAENPAVPRCHHGTEGGRGKTADWRLVDTNSGRLDDKTLCQWCDPDEEVDNGSMPDTLASSKLSDLDAEDVLTDGGQETKQLPETPEDWVLEEVAHRVEATPDGLQDGQSNVWTSKQRLRDDGRKYSTKYSKDEIEAAVEVLQARGEILSWHGLLAPATDEHLKAIIENEQQAGIARSTLVGRCNTLRQGGAADA